MTAAERTISDSWRPAGAADDFPLIVQSHLRWDFVWQRPQQILSRMARTRRVLFVEEPILLDDVRSERLEITQPAPNVYRAVPRLPSYLRDDYDRAITDIRTLVQRAIGKGGPLDGMFVGAVQWFYTPMPAPAMLGAFNERGVVYDCMDELAQFRFAPTDLGQRERLLLDNADVVFTGGHRLYKSKSRFHENVHFFGCGVDASHFAAARAPETEIPHDVADLPGPVFGYFGVIDERLDYDLIGRLAEANPTASVAMVGPVVKVDPRDLPQSPNIRWLGQRDYKQLPSYVKAFDVCLMPFALNEATEYINPTKTLEYMAAGKPIVSTPVADVITNFTPIVRVARDADEFVTVAGELALSPDAAMLARGIDRARAESWESIVSQMQSIIYEAVTAPDAAIAAEEDIAADTAPAPAPVASRARSSATVAATGSSSSTAALASGELSA
ncbi:MAG TPA: glycosyltransferase [Gemmatimonadaceae bacterium]|nr:glycosyltransferase [Gemmatimonadaceae bacterium]